jgi:hypothetical protein
VADGSRIACYASRSLPRGASNIERRFPPMMKLDESVIGIWFLALGNKADFMALLRRDGDEHVIRVSTAIL